MPETSITHVLMSCNFQWPGFRSTHAAPWSQRVGGFVKAIRDSGASIVTAQELGHDQAASLAHALGEHWSYQRAQGSPRGEGLNTVLWRSEWTDEGLIDRNIRSYGQMQRTLLAVPLWNPKTGEKVTAGSSHFANRSATDLNVNDPAIAQRGQAADVHNAMGTRRRVILGIDSNSPAPMYGGRYWLASHGWTITANGIDIIATRPGVTIQSKHLAPVPSDHIHALVVTFSTNTGDPA